MRQGLIKIIAEKKGITLKDLALKAGISETALHNIINTGSTKVESLEKIAKALNISPGVFFDKNFDPHASVAEPTEKYGNDQINEHYVLNSTVEALNKLVASQEKLIEGLERENELLTKQIGKQKPEKSYTRKKH